MPSWRPFARVGKFGIPILLLLALACSARQTTIVQVPDNQRSKVLRFGEFVGDVNSDLHLPLDVVIPASYELAHLPGAPDDYSYWMPPERVEAVSKSGDLPADTGFFYSKISLGVGYDASRGIFAGIEDRDAASQEAEMKQAGMEDLQTERALLQGGYPAMFTSFRNAAANRVHYNVYIATLYESIVFYVSYTPPDGDSTGGAHTWSRFRSALIEETSHAAPNRCRRGYRLFDSEANEVTGEVPTRLVQQTLRGGGGASADLLDPSGKDGILRP